MSTPLAIILTLFIFALLGYLLGSINAGIIITKLFIKTDIREHGSGNAGMTNVTRVAGKLPGAITFIWDFLKGVAASGIARYACTPLLTLFLGENADTLLNPAFAAGIGALFCIIGHMFPVFFGFRGGKGVATIAGAGMFVDWRVACLALAIFGILVLTTKYVSLSSIIAAGTAWITLFLFYDQSITYTYFPFFQSRIIVTLLMLCMSAAVVLKHRTNIVRLIHGNERRIGQKKKD